MAKWIAATIGILLLCCVAEAGVVRGSHEVHSGSVIVQWNQLAYDIAYAEDQFNTFKGQRAIAMVHLAQHDALNAIVRRFEPYQTKHRVAEADPIAASAQAGREILRPIPHRASRNRCTACAATRHVCKRFARSRAGNSVGNG